MLRVALKGLLTHRVRLVATAIAVVLGVSFLTATQALTASVTRSFEGLFAQAYENVDVVVRSTTTIQTPFGGPQRARISEDVLPAVTATEDVEAAEGQIAGSTVLVDDSGESVRQRDEPPALVFNWLTDPQLNPWRIVEGSPPTSTDEVAIDERTAREEDLSLGDELRAGPDGLALRVTGIANFRDLESIAGAAGVLVATPTAQELVGEPGKFDQVLVRGQEGTSPGELVQRVGAGLPAAVEAVTAETATDEGQDDLVDAIDQIRQALLVFGFVALGVGGFIIYNTFSVIVAQRARELALLRAVGASRTQIGLSVLTESVVVGTIAAVIGVGIGIAIGALLLRLLVAFGFGFTSVPLVISAGDAVTAALVGIGVTVVSALLPAWRASRVPPIAALRDVSVDRPGRLVLRGTIGSALVFGGAALLVRTVLAGSRLEAVGICAVLVFGGMVVLGPLIARPFVQWVGRPLPSIGGVSARLARENAARNPRRTAATASALMVGIGLVTFIAVAADSIKASTVDAVDRAIQGDLIITSDGAGVRALSTGLAASLRELPEVEALTTFRVGFAEVDGQPQLMLAVDPETVTDLIAIDLVGGSLSDLGDRGFAVPASVAEARGWKLGQVVPVSFRDTDQQLLELVAVYDSVLPAPGDGYLVGQQLHTEVFPEVDQTDHTVYVELARGTPIDEGRAAVEEVASAFPSAQVRDISEFKRDRIDRINSFLLVLYALLALALVIAVMGIVNTLLLAVYERTHEVGLLRAVGMSRRQLAASICWESVMIAVLGACTGLAVGVLFGWALVRGLEDEGARVFSAPGGQLAALGALSAVAGLAAALYPGWRAARLDILRAVSTE